MWKDSLKDVAYGVKTHPIVYLCNEHFIHSFMIILKTQIRSESVEDSKSRYLKLPVNY